MLVYNAIWNVLYTLIKISDFPIVLCVFKYKYKYIYIKFILMNILKLGEGGLVYI